MMTEVQSDNLKPADIVAVFSVCVCVCVELRSFY